jgi:hypothetical protein
MNEAFRAIDDGQILPLVLLDLSSAFDLVDHSLLMNRLLNMGVVGEALRWFQVYLSDRYQRVFCADSKSTPALLVCGVPQGSVLGPLLFTTFITSITEAWSSHGVQGVLYADDIQLFLKTRPENLANAIEMLEKSVHDTQKWLLESGLFLNATKTEFIILSSKPKSSSLLATPLRVNNILVESKACVRDLGVVLDNHLSMERHICNITKNAFFYLRTIGKIRRHLTPDLTTLLVHALVLSRVDFCCSLLLGITQKQLRKLQKLLRYAGHLVEGRGRTGSEVTMRQRWLSVKQRIELRLALIATTALMRGVPQHLAALLIPARLDESPRVLRSHALGLLEVPRTRTVAGGRAFAVAAPLLLNKLPRDMRENGVKRKELVALITAV